jgi:hypothetical protein
MNDKPRRRWFNFSLRTLFILVTVLCCWLGWEMSVVRSRQAALSRIKGNMAFSVTTAQSYRERWPAGMSVPTLATIPLVRRLLGDEAIQEIVVHRWFQSFSEEELSRLTRAFPEAQLSETHPEPCHPGCFPRGTLVETPQGHRLIETIQAGDMVTAFLKSGERLDAPVQSVFITDNRLWEVQTDEATLITTETQPLCLATDRTLGAGKLQPGDTILRSLDGDVHAVKILAVTQTGRIEKVFNLILGDSELFSANGFLARSKPPAAVATR